MKDPTESLLNPYTRMSSQVIKKKKKKKNTQVDIPMGIQCRLGKMYHSMPPPHYQDVRV